MFSDSKNKNFYFLVLILLLIIAIIGVYNFLYLKEIDKNKDIKVINEVTEVKEIEKKIAIPCLKCDGEKLKETQENIVNIKGNIQEINGVKHHHYIVPDSDFHIKDGVMEKGIIQNGGDSFISYPTLIHKFMQKLNPNFTNLICWCPSFNENDQRVSISTEIKHPPLDLVGIYFDKGTRFRGDDDSEDWNKYTFDEVVKETNGAENVYYFWRSNFQTKKFYDNIKNSKVDLEKIDLNNRKSNEPHCPTFAKVLTQEDINNIQQDIPKEKEDQDRLQEKKLDELSHQKLIKSIDFEATARQLRDKHARVHNL